MNIFRSESAPYVVALIVSALGWFATNIAQELSSRQIAAYSIEKLDGKVQIVIDNISKSSVISNAALIFACADGRSNCFSTQNGQPQKDLTATIPFFPADLVVTGDAQRMDVTVTLVANSRFDITLYPVDSNADVMFFYQPDPAKPVNILFLEDSGLTVWYIRNYFGLLLVCLYVSIGLVLIFVSISLYQLRQTAKPGG